MDPRCQPREFMNIKGAEAIVLHNVCGHVGPNIKDIVGADDLFSLKEIAIIHHTDCGALLIDEAKIRALLKERAPSNTEIDEETTFGAIRDVEQSVRDDIGVIRASPLIRRELAERATGYVYDIKTGMLRPVAE
ncbi:MAG: hypothetical protein Q9227_001010 [Pyrenula ochraceoflavens]